MLVNPLVVNELRALFKSGATPSALIRRIADRHSGEPRLDVLVREYFREAFYVSMIRVGPDQVRHMAEGGSLAILNVTVVHRMIQTRRQWDLPAGVGGRPNGCWLDTVVSTDEADMVAAADPKQIPELAGSWDRMDDEAREFIKRIIGNSRSSQEKVNALAALAERIQQQAAEAVPRIAQGA